MAKSKAKRATKRKYRTRAASFQGGTDALRVYLHELLHAGPPERWPVSGDAYINQIDIRPGVILMLGGQPGIGKTALTMQLVVDALRLTPDLRALIANVEMTPSSLLERCMARLSRIDSNVYRERQLMQDGKLVAEYQDRFTDGKDTLASIADRLSFMSEPWTLRNVAQSADITESRLLVIDYIQRLTDEAAPVKDANPRTAINAMMAGLRRFANEGCAVIVISRLNRGKDLSGSTSYRTASLASFAESSELEYGADSAYILTPGDTPQAKQSGIVIAKHVKCRFGPQVDVTMKFDAPHCEFTGCRPSR